MEEAFFLHPANRDFVAGRRKRNAQWSRHFSEACMWLFLALIIVMIAVLHFGYNAFEPGTVQIDGFIAIMATLIALLKIDFAVAEGRKHAKLSAHGQIVRGDIIKVREDKHFEDGDRWAIDFSFVSPQSGQILSGTEKGLGTREAPCETIQVLFLNDQTFCAL